MNNTFSSHLQQLRKNATLTNRELADLADVPESLISGLQNNNRRVGEYQARKIGLALKLEGAALDDFIYEAINTCTEKVLDAFVGYPAELLNLLASQLRKAGILPETIYDYTVSDGDVSLTLTDGKKATLLTQLSLV
jgi:transcriptional regulator with XRE-family HTH domain